MKLIRKGLKVLAVLLVMGLAALAIAMSHDSPCAASSAQPAGATGGAMMKALVARCYGSAEVLKLESVAQPVPADDEVLVKVHAASVNPLDWHTLRGKPYVMRLDGGFGVPDQIRQGTDFAGTVEAVGKSVKRFKPGDEVFGGRNGAFGEYVTVRESRAIALKPANVSFEQAAATPIAAISALQALRDTGQIKVGQKVLINGASGGVGTYAVQLAKSFGAVVTGVTSTKNVELVRSLGADAVIDYTQQDFTQGAERYDLIVDAVGNHPLLDIRRVMTQKGIVVVIGGPGGGDWIGPLTPMLEALIISPFVSQEFKPFLSELTQKDLMVVADLMQTGKLVSVIDRRYSLSEVPAAITYLETGHARGKVVIDVDTPSLPRADQPSGR